LAVKAKSPEPVAWKVIKVPAERHDEVRKRDLKARQPKDRGAFKRYLV
jgi:hypothetical protein